MYISLGTDKAKETSADCQDMEAATVDFSSLI